MNSVDAKRQRLGFDVLSESERIVTLFSYLRFEISLGGLSGFYGNTAGKRAVESVWALEMLGASRTADVLRRANGMFPGGTPSNDQDQRLASLQPEQADALQELTDEYYRLETIENHDALIEKFINGNFEKLLHD